MGRSGDDVTLRVLSGGSAQEGDNVKLAPFGQRQAGDDVTLVSLERDAAQPGDDVVLVPGMQGGAMAPGDDDEPEAPPYADEDLPDIAQSWTARSGNVERRLARQWLAPWLGVNPLPAGVDLPWRQGKPLPVGFDLSYGSLGELPRRYRAPHGATDPIARAVALAIAGVDRMDRHTDVPWSSDLEQRQRLLDLVYNHPPAKRRSVRMPHGETPRRVHLRVVHRYNHPPAKRDRRRLPWGETPAGKTDSSGVIQGKRPPPEPEPEPEPEPDQPPWVQPGDNVQLDFDRPLLDIPGDRVGLALGFGAFDTAQRSIIVAHDITVTRDSDDTPVPVSSIRLSHDRDSWAWDVRLKLLGRDAYDTVRPDGAEPRVLRIEIDGIAWKMIAEDVQREARHGGDSYNASGRSLTALLGEPYEPPADYTEPNDRTAIQLANERLPNDDWSITWDTVDWLVPGDVYTQRDQTPIAAIQRIAEAVGARVDPSRDSQSLTIVPRYPVSPREWDSETPDVTLGPSVLRQIGIQPDCKPAYEKIWISGEDQGVLFGGIRDGTAGNLNMEPVVEALITEAKAGRERSRIELDGQGPGQILTIETPLIAPPDGVGLINVGALIEITEPDNTTWRGIVDDVQITVDGAGVGQQLTIERRWINDE